MILKYYVPVKQTCFHLKIQFVPADLIKEIVKRNKDTIKTDSSKVSVSLDDTFGDPPLKMLKECEHGLLLLQNGFEEDLNYASSIDTTDVIPYFVTNVLK